MSTLVFNGATHQVTLNDAHGNPFGSWSTYNNVDNSEAVARLLVDRWDTLPALAELIKRDPALKRFVLRHVEPTLNTDDLDKIKALAASKYPADSTMLCNEPKKSAVRAAK